MRFMTDGPSFAWISTTLRKWGPGGGGSRRCALALAMVSLGASAAGAQPISGAPPVLSPDNVEPVQGACSVYQSTLTSQGITLPSGVTRPGSCRYSNFEPLFDGKTLADYWTSVTAGTTRPFHRTIKGPNGLEMCATETGLTVTLSAQVQVSRLDWMSGQPSGTACSNEANRVDPAGTINTSILLGDANTVVNGAVQNLRATPSVTACTNRKKPGLTAALDLKVKARLQALADLEQQRWAQVEATLDSPGSGAANVCMPHCGVCSPGWAGQISCVKTVTGPGYNHNETQNWFVGGATQLQAGQTLYPTEWTSTGSGGDSAESWTVNATGSGKLAVFSNAQGINFARANSEITVFNGIHGTPTSYTDDEFQFLPFLASGPTTAVDSHTYTGQPCDTPVTPGGSVCTVVCNWNLGLQ